MQVQVLQKINSRSIFRLLKLLVCFVAISILAHDIGLAAQASRKPSGACQIKSARGNIQHVIYLIFDNVHFLRDNPNVPSDLEQMPNLLNFIRSNGTLLTNNHTVLISHTANGILTNLTGMYSDRHGQSVANSYRYFKSDGTTLSSSSFKYWTDLVDDTGAPPADPLPNMVNADSGTPKNAPAPWVPYTRASCDFGAVALANIVLENTSTGGNGDITKVFGAGSPEFTEARHRMPRRRTLRCETLLRRTLSVSRSTAAKAAASAPATHTRAPISCPTNPADTTAISACSERST
jgi:hypothetical protein